MPPGTSGFHEVALGRAERRIAVSAQGAADQTKGNS